MNVLYKKYNVLARNKEYYIKKYEHTRVVCLFLHYDGAWHTTCSVFFVFDDKEEKELTLEHTQNNGKTPYIQYVSGEIVYYFTI